MLGQSQVFRNVVRSMRLVAATDATVLITGESGTGKELMAHAMHRESRRKDHPFITVNCAAIPDHLVESELFGHIRGAFTGALRDMPGKAQSAHRGTLFLDEIGELPLAVQSKLLRFIETGECQPVGQPRPNRVDVRVIAATNRNLEDMIANGQFRRDLFYRLFVVPLELPPLRERNGDIPLLVREITKQLAAEYKLETPEYTKAAINTLNRYRWPGNIRELKNLCERMLIWFAGRRVDVENLPREVHQQYAPTLSMDLYALPEDGVVLEELESHLIRQALERTLGNRSKAARLLGLTRDTLLYRIKKYEIDTV